MFPLFSAMRVEGVSLAAALTALAVFELGDDGLHRARWDELGAVSANVNRAQEHMLVVDAEPVTVAYGPSVGLGHTMAQLRWDVIAKGPLIVRHPHLEDFSLPGMASERLPTLLEPLQGPPFLSGGQPHRSHDSLRQKQRLLPGLVFALWRDDMQNQGVPAKGRPAAP